VVPGLALEDLAAVPVEEVLVRAPLRALRPSDGLVVEPQQRLVEPLGADGLVGNDETTSRPEGEGAQVAGWGRPVA
jgi:hypothetical protein